ncbi:XrtA/PEP-CTERM system histidine kinase PrsK [Sphingomonas sp. IC4-52]|uniref:XrtA/PEP-CTERM system histidine kinase PrsK n=1 Tax=Sphingomonas sp. IC4-52 TaxID=2887202 RepID=UPI001D103F46|nr:XrtA/PEP-CTERM system histidine kinase PrsK [Sphingomonas sp. IC4-52]MCC2979844.1 PEP-CTERM system histidine kinase PrsK [Sphingomonas sp. IC4-52]
MNAAPITLWTHALAALLFGTLALSQWRGGGVLPRAPFLAGLFATALWALAVAGLDARDVATRLAECARNLTWLWLMYSLARREPNDRAWPSVRAVYAAVAVVTIGCGILALGSVMVNDARAVLALLRTRLLLQMLGATGALILVNRLRQGSVWRRHSGERMAIVALAMMWSTDLLVFASAWLTGHWPAGLIDLRGAVMVALTPLFSLAVQRADERKMQASRTVALLSLAMVAVALYVAVTALATAIIGSVGGSYARVVQTALIFGTTAALLALVSTPWTRAWARVLVSKHLFSHRYDYRTEWLRFTETLGAPGTQEESPLDVRVVKAVADLTDSPRGLLLLPDGAALGTASAWNWPDAPSTDQPDERLFVHLAATGRIIELDAVRAGTADPADQGCVSPWLRDDEHAWVIVPLRHLGQLAGAVVLARPAINRALDWEDFDLFGVAGRQAASYLAEARAHAALADAQRFDEFNRRFAFIMHDLKNLVSQLTLVARNAERHADNPAFRADMVATLTDSSDRMNALLARLSQHHASRAEKAQPVPLLALAERIAAGRRAQHPVTASGDPGALALADPGALETLISHLVQNAVEASAAGAEVQLIVSAADGEASITVADYGRGMSPAFVRDQLFRPFVSGKPGGFGLGAFEARQLAEGMGGSISVSSREGAGSSFRVALPLAPRTMGGMELAA